MKLSDHQFKFLQDVCRLIGYCAIHKIKVTGGELFRTQYQQDEYLRTGKSKIKNSQHMQRLAIDLNFFIDGNLVYEKQKLENIGLYWQGLNKLNRWGGFFRGFVDTCHFERKVKT
jgi:peptidoglycan L-alanyl-D-glutamate endopeptidase CwlK